VHRDIGVAAQERVFEFFGEKPFAALFFERPFHALIAGRDDFQQLDIATERGVQMRGDLLGLRERERTFTGGKDEFFQNH
jgi:hypothetical protein